MTLRSSTFVGYCLVSLVLLSSSVNGAQAATSATQPDGSKTELPYPVDHDAPLAPTERVDCEAATYTRLRVEFNGIRGDHHAQAYVVLTKTLGAEPPVTAAELLWH
jgi:hypothetical protein